MEVLGVDALVSNGSCVAKGDECRVDFGVPDATGLLQAVKGLAEFEHFVPELREVVESFRGANEDDLVRGELGLDVRGVDVCLLDVVTVLCCKGEEKSNRGESGDWGECLVVIEALALGEALSDKSDFPLNDLAEFVLLGAKDELRTNRAITRSYLGWRDDLPHAQSD